MDEAIKILRQCIVDELLKVNGLTFTVDNGDKTISFTFKSTIYFAQVAEDPKMFAKVLSRIAFERLVKLGNAALKELV